MAAAPNTLRAPAVPIFALSLGALLLAAPACSSTGDATSAPPSGNEDGGVEAAPTRSDACLAQDAALQAMLDSDRKSPNALLAVKNEACGTTVYASGDAKTGTATSLFRIGSMTKTFVSATILSLVKEGKVSLDDPLSKWVEAVPNTDGVTVHMLLNHTSGIFNFAEVPGFPGNNAKKKWTPRELVDLVATQKPNFAPGKGWHYSNTNYVLLGMIAEAASGQKLGALVRERALVPAGLQHTFFAGDEPVEGTMDDAFIDKTSVMDILDPSVVWAAGAMVATPEDVANWFGALYTTDAVLDADGRALLTKDPASPGQGRQYGLGVTMLSNLTTHGEGPALGHDGDLPGYHCAGYYFTDKKTTIASFVNQEGQSASGILFGAAEILFR